MQSYNEMLLLNESKQSNKEDILLDPMCSFLCANPELLSEEKMSNKLIKLLDETLPDSSQFENLYELIIASRDSDKIQRAKEIQKKFLDEKIVNITSKKFYKDIIYVFNKVKKYNILGLQDKLVSSLGNFSRFKRLYQLKSLAKKLNEHKLLSEVIGGISVQLKIIIKKSELDQDILAQFFDIVNIMKKSNSPENEFSITYSYQMEILKEFLKGSEKLSSSGEYINLLHLFSEETDENKQIFSQMMEKIENHSYGYGRYDLSDKYYNYIEKYFRNHFNSLNDRQKEVIASIEAQEVIRSIKEKPFDFDIEYLIQVTPYLSNKLIFTALMENLFETHSKNVESIPKILSELKSIIPQKEFNEEQLEIIRKLISSKKNKTVFYEYVNVPAAIAQYANILGFEPSDVHTITFDSPLEDHVAWVFNNIYSREYPDGEKKLIHGIQHVTRAMLLVPVLVNLYRRYGSQDAIDLSDRTIKALQIGMLFHDAARLNEGTDYWDEESGILLNTYLVKILQFSKEEADTISFAVANKDSKEPKNILQYIAHDADCLEIVRARPRFDGTYLDFVKHIASKNKQAHAEIAQLIREERSIVEAQGDGYKRLLHHKKAKYTHKEAYHAIKSSILKDKKIEPKEIKRSALGEVDPRDMYQVFPKLLEPLDEKTVKAMTLLNESERSDDNILIFRGIANPSLECSPARSKRTNELKPAEIEVEREIRKSFRTEKEFTRAGYLGKNGNDFRSVSWIGVKGLGRGGLTYCSTGFLGDAKLKNIKKIDSKDIGSGTGKKIRFSYEIIPLSEEEKQTQLTDLNAKLEMGGNSAEFIKDNIGYHTELSYHIEKDTFHSICFTLDPNLANFVDYGYYNPTSRFKPILEAIFMQQVFERQTRVWSPEAKTFKPGKILPIKEYSGIHNYLVDREYSQEDIILMWKTLIHDYIEEKFYKNKDELIINKSISEIKKMPFKTSLDNLNPNPFQYYSEELKEKIDELIASDYKKLVDNRKKSLKLILEDSKENILQDPMKSLLCAHPELLSEEKISNKLIQLLVEIPPNTSQFEYLYELIIASKDNEKIQKARDIKKNFLKEKINQINEETFFWYIDPIFNVLKKYNIVDLQDLLLLKLYNFQHINCLKDLDSLAEHLDKHGLLSESVIKNLSSQLKRLIEKSELTDNKLSEFFSIVRTIQKSHSSENKLPIFIPYSYQIEILKKFLKGPEQFSPCSSWIPLLHLFTEDTVENRKLFSQVIKKISITEIGMEVDCYNYVELFFERDFPLLNFWQKEVISSIQSEEICRDIKKNISTFFPTHLPKITPYLSNKLIFTTLMEYLFGRYSYAVKTILEMLSKLKNGMPKRAFNKEQLDIIRTCIPSRHTAHFYEYINTGSFNLFDQGIGQENAPVKKDLEKDEQKSMSHSSS